MKTTMTGLIFGESGVGKSWLADTAPAPRLVIDLEGRARYAPSQPKVAWDPRTQAPPVADGSWETCVVSAADFDTPLYAYQWMRTGQHPFVSATVDSLMEAQKRCIDQAVGVAQLDQQDWGVILRKLEAMVRQFRDLTLLPDNPLRVMLFLVGAVDSDGMRRPLLQGQLRLTVPYYLDIVGYLFPTPNDEGTFSNSLLVWPQPGFVAKDGTGRLPGPIIQNPNIAQLVQLLDGKPEEVR